MGDRRSLCGLQTCSPKGKRKRPVATLSFIIRRLERRKTRSTIVGADSSHRAVDSCCCCSGPLPHQRAHPPSSHAHKERPLPQNSNAQRPPRLLFHLERKRTSLNSKAGENETRRFVLPAATGNQSVVKKIRCNQGDLLKIFRCRRRRCCPLSPRSSSYSSSSSIPPFLLHLFTLSSLFAIIILFHSIYLHKSIASFANSRQSTSSSCASERKTQRKG